MFSNSQIHVFHYLFVLTCQTISFSAVGAGHLVSWKLVYLTDLLPFDTEIPTFISPIISLYRLIPPSFSCDCERGVYWSHNGVSLIWQSMLIHFIYRGSLRQLQPIVRRMSVFSSVVSDYQKPIIDLACDKNWSARFMRFYWHLERINHKQAMSYGMKYENNIIIVAANDYCLPKINRFIFFTTRAFYLSKSFQNKSINSSILVITFIQRITYLVSLCTFYHRTIKRFAYLMQ